MVDPDRFLNGKDHECFFDLKTQISISNNNDFVRLQRNLMEAAVMTEEKRMLINEVRKSQ